MYDAPSAQNTISYYYLFSLFFESPPKMSEAILEGTVDVRDGDTGNETPSIREVIVLLVVY